MLAKNFGLLVNTMKQLVFGLLDEVNIRMKDLKETREYFPIAAQSATSNSHREEVDQARFSLHQTVMVILLLVGV